MKNGNKEENPYSLSVVPLCVDSGRNMHRHLLARKEYSGGENETSF
jgi:hypothetical protein